MESSELEKITKDNLNEYGYKKLSINVFTRLPLNSIDIELDEKGFYYEFLASDKSRKLYIEHVGQLKNLHLVLFREHLSKTNATKLQ